MGMKELQSSGWQGK